MDSNHPPDTPRRRRLVLVTAGVTAALLAAGIAVQALRAGPDQAAAPPAAASAAPAAVHSFFTGADVSEVTTGDENRPVELGLRFTAGGPGAIRAVRFLRGAGDDSAHRVTVWSGAGRKLAAGRATAEGGATGGWQQVELTTPVRVEAGEEYVVSYHTTRYQVSQNYFTGLAPKAGPLTAVGAGVFAYGDGGFPEESFAYSNYWVDVVFTAGEEAALAASGAGAAPSSDAAVARGGPLNLPVVPWEGGPAYYEKFGPARAAGLNDPAFFPLGVWFESVLSGAEVARDKGAGLNTYVELTSNSDIGVVRRGGMKALVSERFAGLGRESVGWLLTDEPDMWAGPGNGRWSGKSPGKGKVCATAEPCGYDVLKQLTELFPEGDGRLRYANYGKGVMFWESDDEAAGFVNGWTDVVSADIYWYTDPSVCTSGSEGPALGVPKERCRRAANYGRTMDRIRHLDGLDGERQPVWAFVEVGHPFAEADAPTINGGQIAGAVMNSLIHEARGILYFNHNFGGPCISQHVLRDDCGKAVRPAVTEINRRITALAPVLNSPSYEWDFNPALDTMLKAHDGSFYVFAMPGVDGGTGTQRLTLPPGLRGSRAEVLFENRSVPIISGAVEDAFAEEYSYHVYRIKP